MYPKNSLLACTILTIITVASFFVSGCDKKEDINPFSNITTLDCRNLIIRDVSLNGNFIEVKLENTCKSCEDDWVYLGMIMIDKKMNHDTIAQTCYSCLSCPKNGKVEKYQLTTKLSALPDLKDVQFNFSYLCTDVTYQKK